MNDMFQVDYLPDEKKIKINLFKKNWLLRNKKKVRLRKNERLSLLKLW